MNYYAIFDRIHQMRFCSRISIIGKTKREVIVLNWYTTIAGYMLYHMAFFWMEDFHSWKKQESERERDNKNDRQLNMHRNLWIFYLFLWCLFNSHSLFFFSLTNNHLMLLFVCNICIHRSSVVLPIYHLFKLRV